MRDVCKSAVQQITRILHANCPYFLKSFHTACTTHFISTILLEKRASGTSENMVIMVSSVPCSVILDKEITV